MTTTLMGAQLGSRRLTPWGRAATATRGIVSMTMVQFTCMYIQACTLAPCTSRRRSRITDYTCLLFAKSES